VSAPLYVFRAPSITLPTDFILYDSGYYPSMIVNALLELPSAGTLSLATGTQTVLVGATLNVSRCSNRRFYNNNDAGFQVTMGIS
jgi:hypothetical protein